MKATVIEAKATKANNSNNKRYLHSSIASFVLLLTFAGFAQSYYLKKLFDSAPLSALLHIHGLVMTLWLLLFLLQVRLIAAGQLGWHRRVGMLGMGLGLLAMGIGIATAIDSARRVQAEIGGLSFLATSLGGLLVFVTLVMLGYIYRRQRDFHSRFMLLANLSILAPAIARLPLEVIEHGGMTLIFIIKDVCVLAFVAIDFVRTRRFHPATVCASVLIIASYPITRFIGTTSVWIDIAKWLVN